MKDTVIKSVTAFLCVVAICITSFVAVGKYSDAMKEVAKYQPAAGTALNGGAAGGNSATPADGTDTTDPAADGTDTTDPAADGTDATQAGGTPAANGATTTKKAGATATDPTKYNKDQVVNYYNTCLKNSYNQKVTITKTEQIKITVDKVTGGTPIKNIANSLASKYATANTESMSFVNGKSSTGKTADSFTLPTKLVPAGAKTATVKKSGAGYEINITLISEASTLTKFPTYNKQCSYPLDLASVDLSPAKVVQADLTYTGTTLKTIVDGNGRVTSNVVYMPLSGTGAGKAIGITLTADVHGSWNHTATFKY